MLSEGRQSQDGNEDEDEDGSENEVCEEQRPLSPHRKSSSEYKKTGARSSSRKYEEALDDEGSQRSDKESVENLCRICYLQTTEKVRVYI